MQCTVVEEKKMNLKAAGAGQGGSYTDNILNDYDSFTDF